jgi:hypothetical protein
LERGVDVVVGASAFAGKKGVVEGRIGNVVVVGYTQVDPSLGWEYKVDSNPGWGRSIVSAEPKA